MPATNAPSILLIENNSPPESTLLAAKLEKLGFSPHKVSEPSEAIQKVASGVYELILLDLTDKHRAVRLLRKLRAISTVPIIVISTRSSAAARIAALNQGADDVVDKPFDVQELLARSKAILRRVIRTRRITQPLNINGLIIDLEARQVKRGELCLSLSAKESRLLQILAVQEDSFVSQQVLIAHVWGERHLDDRDYLRVLVRKVRQKIEEAPAKPRILVGKRGIGYKLTRQGDPQRA